MSHLQAAGLRSRTLVKRRWRFLDSWLTVRRQLPVRPVAPTRPSAQLGRRR
jgi:hypothetical protein